MFCDVKRRKRKYMMKVSSLVRRLLCCGSADDALSDADEAEIASVTAMEKAEVAAAAAAAAAGPQPEQHSLDHVLALARESPDHWACEQCVALHPVSTSDTPSRPHKTTCPQGWQAAPFNRFVGRAASSSSAPFRLSHRHVQLTLKYVRSRRWRHRLYLRRLLRESHAAFAPAPYGGGTLSGEHSAYPKVVDGRYLLLQAWNFFEGPERVSPGAVGALRVCEHQVFDGHAGGEGGSGLLADTVRCAFRKRECEIYASCPQCPTDFSVKVYHERVLVRVWQDFGGEGSPLDHPWALHVWGSSETGSESETEAEIEVVAEPYHAPGSVRQLFGHCMREALRDARYKRELSESMGVIYIL